MIGAVNDAARPQDVVVCAAGAMPGDLHKLWRTRDPKGYHVEYGYSCMGYEIAGGLGVKLAAPEREVYVLVGDGSYLMLSSELVTAVAGAAEADDRARRQPRLQVDRQPLALARHGRLRHALPLSRERRARRRQRESTDYLPVDLAANAESLGAKVFRAATLDELRAGARGGEEREAARRDRGRGRPLRGRARLRELVGRRRSRRSPKSRPCARRASSTRRRARDGAEPRVIEAVVMGRVGIDLYPNELETPLAEVRTFTRFVGGFAGNVSTGLARLGVRAAIVSRVGDDGHGEFVRAWLAGEGVDVALPRHRPVLADAADVLRGLAARPVPDHLLPPADRARLAALARRLRRRGGRGRAAALRDRHRRSRSRRAARRRSRRCARTAARRSSTSTGGRRCGTTAASTRRSPPRRPRAADIVVGNEEEVEAAQVERADARAQARRARRDGLRGAARRPTCPASRSRS